MRWQRGEHTDSGARLLGPKLGSDPSWLSDLGQFIYLLCATVATSLLKMIKRTPTLQG